LASMLRSRSAALAVGAAVLVTVVVANQPHDEVIGHPQSAAAASTVRADHRAAAPPLRTLQRRVEFGDASAAHSGAPALAADAATALYGDTVGLDRFVAAMNAQIGALGLHDSHFTTPVGLDDPAQLSSAYDLAAVATVAEDMFPTFRQLVSTIDMQLPAAPGH